MYQPPLEEDDEQGMDHARRLIAAMPFSVIGSEKDVQTVDARTVKGRQYSWGVAEVENEDHCDFKKLRSILIRTHMLDLIHTTEETHYEAYRAQQMETRKFGEARPRKLDNQVQGGGGGSPKEVHGAGQGGGAEVPLLGAEAYCGEGQAEQGPGVKPCYDQELGARGRSLARKHHEEPWSSLSSHTNGLLSLLAQPFSSAYSLFVLL